LIVISAKAGNLSIRFEFNKLYRNQDLGVTKAYFTSSVIRAGL